MLDWLMKRLITEKRVKDIMEKASPYATEIMKKSIHDVLNDPDVASHLASYGDHLFDRYRRKFNGMLGGLQKGVNYAVDEAIQENNPLGEIEFIDEDGNISISQIVKGFLKRGLKQGIPQLMGNQQQTSNQAGNIPRAS